MDTSLREGLQILLDSGLLTEIFQYLAFEHVHGIRLDKGDLERSESAHHIARVGPHTLFEHTTGLRSAAIQRLPTGSRSRLTQVHIVHSILRLEDVSI